MAICQSVSEAQKHFVELSIAKSNKVPNYGSLITSPPLREPIASQIAGLIEFVINRTPASARAMFTPPV